MATRPPSKIQLTERDLSRWKLVEDFKGRLVMAAQKQELPATWSEQQRRLSYSDYLSLMLLGLLNPVVGTMRGLCAASHLQRVQQEVCSRPVSLGSFSEAQAVLDPALLQEVFAQLSRVQEELPWSPADRQAGVIRHAWAKLGSRGCRLELPVRVAWVQTPKEVLQLVTHLEPAELSAAEVALLYRQRWQVELFFHWVKCILGCRHWLAESPQGVAIQIYLALIAALLLQLYTGQRPNRRMMELIQFYLQGVASLEKLWAGLERQRQVLAGRKKS